MRPAALIVLAGLVAAGCDGSRTDDLDASPIEIFGPYLGEEARAFTASLDAFEREFDVEVRYTGSADFVADLAARAGSTVDRPDVAMVPQPAVVAELARTGRILPLDQATVTAILDNFDAGVAQLEVEGAIYAVPYRNSVKSVVWFRPTVFAERGWVVPETLDDLAVLADDIQSATDIAPWCFSIFSGSATGWPATDWVEDLVLRRAGPDVYDEWVAGERGFGDRAVRDAFEEFEDLVLRPERSFGGLRTVLERETSDTSAPLFTDPPGCAMFKQATFASAWFPDDTTIGPDDDVDFFVLPAAQPDDQPPLVVGGDSAVRFDDRPEIDHLMAYLASPEGAAEWARRGGLISSRTTVDPERYYRPADRRFAELLVGTDITRFDASDQMPADVGSRLLWQQITAWIAGTVTLDELIATLDAARSAG